MVNEGQQETPRTKGGIILGLKKGDLVVMHTCGEAIHYKGKVWKCLTNERKLHKDHTYKVVWLEGFSGCFMVKYLQKVDLKTLGGILNENY